MRYLSLSWDFKTASGEGTQSTHPSIIFLDFYCYGMFKVFYSLLNFGGQDHVYLGERKKSFILDFITVAMILSEVLLIYMELQESFIHSFIYHLNSIRVH